MACHCRVRSSAQPIPRRRPERLGRVRRRRRYRARAVFPHRCLLRPAPCVWLSARVGQWRWRARMDLSPSTWLRLGENASGDQRVGESHPVAHYFDYRLLSGSSSSSTTRSTVLLVAIARSSIVGFATHAAASSTSWDPRSRRPIRRRMSSASGAGSTESALAGLELPASWRVPVRRKDFHPETSSDPHHGGTGKGLTEARGDQVCGAARGSVDRHGCGPRRPD